MRFISTAKFCVTIITLIVLTLCVSAGAYASYSNNPVLVGHGPTPLPTPWEDKVIAHGPTPLPTPWEDKA